ncbi:MAG: ABC transporter substrate-binding protein [Chthoniobacteraceae bacterium]
MQQSHWKNIAIAALTAFSVAAPLRAEPSQKVHLNVGIIPVPEHSKLIIARDKGYFTQEGLDVQLVEFANSADGLTALRARKNDAGSVGTTAPLVHISKGAEDIRIIGGLGGEGSAVVVRADDLEKIKDIKGLKGLKIGTVRLSSSDAIVRHELTKAGIDWAKGGAQIFELKSPPAVLEAVKSGNVDAGVIWAPFDTKAEEYGLKILVRTGKLSPGHPCCRIAVLSEDLSSRPQVWVSYLKAILRAERFINEEPKESVDIVTAALKIDRKLVDEVITGGNTEFTSDPNSKGIVDFWAGMKESGFVDSDKDISKYIDTTPYKKALDSLLAENPTDAFWKTKLDQFNARD